MSKVLKLTLIVIYAASLLTGIVPLSSSSQAQAQSASLQEEIAVVSPDGNGNLVWNVDTDSDYVADRWPTLGNTSWGNYQVLSGDFNGDGQDDRAHVLKNGSRWQWRIDWNLNSTPDKTFFFGNSWGTPLVGDWNGDRKDDIAVVSPDGNGNLVWSLDTNNNYVADRWPKLGNTAWGSYKLLVADLNGDRKDDLIHVLKNGSRWQWRVEWNLNSTPDKSFFLGNSWGTPVVGDWNGNNRDEVGVVSWDGNGNLVWNLDTNNDFKADKWPKLGNRTWGDYELLVGDLTGDGKDDLVHLLKNGSTWQWRVESNLNSTPDDTFFYGNSWGTPLIGDWNGTNDVLQLNRGDELFPGEQLVSPNNSAVLRMQHDGNLVLSLDDIPIWATGTFEAGSKLRYQMDGNMVLLDPSGQPAWFTGTAATSAATLSDTGNFRVGSWQSDGDCSRLFGSRWMQNCYVPPSPQVTETIIETANNLKAQGATHAITVSNVDQQTASSFNTGGWLNAAETAVDAACFSVEARDALQGVVTQIPYAGDAANLCTALSFYMDGNALGGSTNPGTQAIAVVELACIPASATGNVYAVTGCMTFGIGNFVESHVGFTDPLVDFIYEAREYFPSRCTDTFVTPTRNALSCIIDHNTRFFRNWGF